MERGDSKVPLGIAPPLVACACSEINCPNMPGVRASVFYSTVNTCLPGVAIFCAAPLSSALTVGIFDDSQNRSIDQPG